MMPSIGFKRRAMGLFALSYNNLKGDFLPNNYQAQHNQGPGFWGFMGRLNILNTGISYNSSRNNQKCNDRKCYQRLDFSVAIGMVVIWRAFCVFESDQNQERRKNIGSRFDGIGNQRIRIPEKPCQSFYYGQTGVPDYTEVNSLYGGFFVIHLLIQLAQNVIGCDTQSAYSGMAYFL